MQESGMPMDENATVLTEYIKAIPYICFAFIIVESVNHLGFSDFSIDTIFPYLVGE